MPNQDTRLEHDLLGDMQIPNEAYYGIQTQRALENFQISGVKLYFFPELIEALAEVKLAAALANHDLGALPTPIKDAIEGACREIMAGRWHDQFQVDVV